MASPHFGPELFEFLEDLKQNNDRGWMAENKDRYEAFVKAPMVRFIEDLAPRLEKISPRFVADPRANGGSMFRIHRDTRFSKDKSPYKTQASAQFRHEAGKDVHAPGFYLHLEPDNVFFGVGIYHPKPAIAQTLREAIVERPGVWKKATRSKAFTSRFVLDGEVLKRRPKSLPEDHPFAEDLLRKDFISLQ